MAITYKPVYIKYDSDKQLVVDPFEVHLNRQSEGVEWINQTGAEKFHVSFSETPFDKIYYNQDDPQSGAVNSEALPRKFFRKYFKYSVQVGKDILDPGVIIW